MPAKLKVGYKKFMTNLAEKNDYATALLYLDDRNLPNRLKLDYDFEQRQIDKILAQLDALKSSLKSFIDARDLWVRGSSIVTYGCRYPYLEREYEKEDLSGPSSLPKQLPSTVTLWSVEDYVGMALHKYMKGEATEAETILELERLKTLATSASVKAEIEELKKNL